MADDDNMAFNETLSPIITNRPSGRRGDKGSSGQGTEAQSISPQGTSGSGHDPRQSGRTTPPNDDGDVTGGQTNSISAVQAPNRPR